MNTSQDLTHLRPAQNDEIDLGELLRNLITQWQLICGITVTGALFGIVIALTLPKQYRVEAVFDKPATSNIQPLLAQTLIPMDRQFILGSYLKNLQSRNLIEQALANNNLFKRSEEDTDLSAAERVSMVQNAAKALKIAPAEYDFLPELEDTITKFDQISVNILSSTPVETANWLSSLLTLAAEKTTADLANDVLGQRNVNIQRLTNQLAQLEAAAQVAKQNNINELEAQLAIAQELKITEPTAWPGFSNGSGFSNEANSKQTNAFLMGTRALAAQLTALKNTPVQLQDAVIGVDEEGLPVTVNANLLTGQLETLKALKIDTSSIRLIGADVQALAPANAEKPNRKLIAIAATVLAGFFGLFIALIRLAVRKS